MMGTWSARHAGSPRVQDGLSRQQLATGLADGIWETTDEVQGPADDRFVAFENHPDFAELAEELNAPPEAKHEDPTSLDMNPLIDVCLVLLIFFILTTSYAALQKYLDSPGVTNKEVKGVPVRTKKELAEVTIKVTAKMEAGKPVIRVEDKVVDVDDLVGVLKPLVKQTRKTQMWLDLGDEVSYDTEIRIRDAAKGAGFQKVLLQVAQPAGS